jgi:polar amino acid transport system substrate-binding protein
MRLRDRLHLALALLVGACSTGTAEPVAGTADTSVARVKRAGVLRWGADVVGGIPYVYEDPEHPGEYIGFELEIARKVAEHLDVELELVVKAWDTLVPELQRGSFDMAMNGIEDLPERASFVLFSTPYYIYSQQITVRRDTTGITSLEDLKGKKVATLSGTAADDILRETPGIETVPFPEIIYSYRALESGTVDAVLLDKPIAVAYGTSNPQLMNVGESFSEGRYVIIFRTEDTGLRDAVNTVLADMMQNGELKAIYERFGLMDDRQVELGIK